VQVIERTQEVLVVEQGPGTSIFIGAAFALIGMIFAVSSWFRGETGSLLLLGVGLAGLGVWFVLSAETTTHRFDRPQRRVSIVSKRRRGSKRRELPFDQIADIVLEVIRRRGRSYYVHYVTTSGERIVWTRAYDGSEDDTLECFRAAREFLGLPESPGGDASHG
jgi:hypothetical protein